jgi:oligosaccharide translocation protein RFT1
MKYLYYSGDVLSDEEMLKVAWMIIPFGLLVTFIGSLFVFRVKKLKFSDPYAKATLIIGKSSINQSLLFLRFILIDSTLSRYKCI